jgi:hypothetical protein
MLLSILELLLLIFALVNQQQASSGVDPAFVAIILFLVTVRTYGSSCLCCAACGRLACKLIILIGLSLLRIKCKICF